MGRFKRARHLSLIEREFLETIHGAWDILIVQCPPRHGKTWYLSRAAPKWYHSVYPENQSMLISYGLDLARKASEYVRNEVDALSGYYQNGGINHDHATATDWEMANGYGGMKAAGIGGGITGRGADLMCIDDYLKNAEEAVSDDLRDSQWEWFQTTAFTRIEPGGKLVVLATRWMEDDLIGRILKFALEDTELRVREIRLPALAEPTESQPDPLGRVTDEPLWPERIDYRYLDVRRRIMEPYWWNAVYQQRLGTYGRNDWPTEYFYGILADDDDWPEQFGFSATALDPSKGKNTKAGDFSAIVNVGYARGKLWVEVDMQRRPAPQMMADLVAFNERIRPTVTGIESVAFQELLAQDYMQAQHEMGIYRDEPELIDNTVNKQLRIGRLGLWLRLHMFKIKRNAGGLLLLEQLKGFPNAKHDDGCFAAGTQIDTLRGEVPIEQVREGDYVLTRFGYRRVLLSGCTGIKPTMRCVASDGSELVATLAHPVYNGHSFSPMRSQWSLYKCESMCQASPNLLSSMESSSGVTHGRRNGRTQVATRFITATKTHSITPSIILSASRKPSTTSGIQPSDQQGLAFQVRPFGELRNGMPHPLADNGTLSMASVSHKTFSPSSATAHFVETPTKRKPRTERSFAQRNADSEAMPLVELPVVAKHILGEELVYNLTVDGGEYLANGFVVHNCDALEMAMRLLLRLSEELLAIQQGALPHSQWSI